MTDQTTIPRAWVGCLACYNAGRLLGEWVDGLEAADLDTDTLHAGQGVTVDPLYGDHAELWVMDHEGYAGLLSGECSPTEATALASTIDTLGGDLAAYAAYAGHVGEAYATVEGFRAAYRGQFGSVEEYAEEYLDGKGDLPSADTLAGRYFNLTAFARDLVLGGDVTVADAPGGGVYVLANRSGDGVNL